jgi:peptide deformylase
MYLLTRDRNFGIIVLMILDILKVGNPADEKILRKKSFDIKDFTQETHDFCMNLIETMFAANGVGLAAPQVGRNENIFVMRDLRGMKSNVVSSLILINPRVVVLDGGSYKDQEGCLSIPGFWGDVWRQKDAVVEFYDATGKPQKECYAGFQARVFQHEFDHLVGKLFTDRAKKVYPK